MARRLTVEKVGPGKIDLVGSLDEACGPALTALKALVAAEGDVSLNCARISSINSIGVGLWSGFLQGLETPSKVSLERCSVYLVDYATMCPELMRGARVASVLVPYCCDDCGYASEQLFPVAKDLKKSGFPAKKCESCGKNAAVAEVEADEYLEGLGG